MYTIAADILAVLPGLPQTSTAAGYSATVAIINSHITRSDALIDAKLARRYSVPLATTATSTPPLISSLSQDVTSWFCYRSLFSKDSSQRFEYLDDFYAHAIKTLDEISSGMIDLVNTAGSVISEVNVSGKVYSTMESYSPVFDMGSELKWRVDPDLVADTDSAR